MNHPPRYPITRSEVFGSANERLIASRAAELERDRIAPSGYHRLIREAKRRHYGVVSTFLVSLILMLHSLFGHFSLFALIEVWIGAGLFFLAVNASRPRT